MVNLVSRKPSPSEARRSIRVQEKMPVTWHVQNESLTGTARIRNISESGMMLETNTNIADHQNCVLAFEPPIQVGGNILPALGRIVWSRKRGFSANNFVCGVAFIEPAQEVIAHLRERIAEKVLKVRSVERVKDIAGIVLSLALVALSAFAYLQQIGIQQNYEQSTQLLLTSSTQQASLYTQVYSDLKETKEVLAETEALLAQVKEQNAALQNELQAANINIQALTDENNKLAKEVNSLKEKLRPFEGEIGSMDEAKSFSQIVRNRLREIKGGIRVLKQKAYLAKVAAQREKDQILLAQGNQGYLIKDSQPVNNSFPSAKQEKKVKINVDLFE